MENRVRPLSTWAAISRETRGWAVDGLKIVGLVSFIYAAWKMKDIVSEAVSAVVSNKANSMKKNEENDGFSDPE